MDKLPVTPSPHRFLLKNQTKNTPVPPLGARAGHGSVKPGPELLVNPAATPPPVCTPDATAGPETWAGNGYVLDERASAEVCRNNGSATVNAGTREGADAAGSQRRMRNGEKMRGAGRAFSTPRFKMDSRHSSQGETRRSAVTPQQTQTPSLSQFKAAPKFRFGSSQNRSPSAQSLGTGDGRGGARSTSHVAPRPTPGRWRATQTPLRQSLRRELTEEEIVDVDDGDVQMQDLRQSIERGELEDYDDEPEQRSYVELDFETPAPKRRKVSVDPVEPFSVSHSENENSPSYRDHVDLRGRDNLNEGADQHADDEAHQNEDEEMLYGDDEGQDEELGLHDMPPITRRISTHPPPETPKPVFSQRPRFVLSSSTRSSFAPPATPQAQISTQPKETFARAPHFILRDQTPIHNPNDDNEPQFIKPPKFKPIEEPEPSEPLPAEFSPRKRGQKFVVGGLANEVRSWLVDLENQQTPATKPHKDHEGWNVKMLVEEATPGKGVGWTLAKGKMQDGHDLCMILGGEGMMEGLEKGREVGRGEVVGIRAPVWEVDVKGVRWGVGANWKTLARGG